MGSKRIMVRHGFADFTANLRLTMPGGDTRNEQYLLANHTRLRMGPPEGICRLSMLIATLPTKLMFLLDNFDRIYAIST